MKAGRRNAGRALRMGIGIEEGLDDGAAVGGEQKTKVSESSARQRFMDEYEWETERYLRRDDPAGFDAELLERLDRGEQVRGSSVCDLVEEWSTMTEEFEMLNFSSSPSQSAEYALEDGWAVVSEVG